MAINASSTLTPVLADVSMNVTLYSLASLSPSSLFTVLSALGQSHLLPEKKAENIYPSIFLNTFKPILEY